MRPEKLAQKAKGASDILAHASTDEKNRVLERLADALGKNQDYLYEENMKDVRAAEKEGMAKSLIDRLRIDDNCQGDAGELEGCGGPPGPRRGDRQGLEEAEQPLVGRMRIPIGVILIIYESRPNVTIEAFSLCLKSGNCVILKGGSEAYHTPTGPLPAHRGDAEGSKISPDAVQFVDTADRDYIYSLLERRRHRPRHTEGARPSSATSWNVPAYPFSSTTRGMPHICR
jgi:glutamate-5-semialdehyde dehydrogenase